LADLKQLYQGLIVKHSQAPENYRELPGCTHQAARSNPLCGDEISVQVRIAGTCIAEAAFQGSACAICMASASLMTGALVGLELEEARKLDMKFCSMFEESTRQQSEDWLERHYPDLVAFGGIRNFPVRIRCAKLPWEALTDALNSGEGS
jgi:nitrogen fixation NifU-like protein